MLMSMSRHHLPNNQMHAKEQRESLHDGRDELGEGMGVEQTRVLPLVRDQIAMPSTEERVYRGGLLALLVRVGRVENVVARQNAHNLLDCGSVTASVIGQIPLLLQAPLPSSDAVYLAPSSILLAKERGQRLQR